jgi:Fe-Mn family superoxide dismutase
MSITRRQAIGTLAVTVSSAFLPNLVLRADPALAPASAPAGPFKLPPLPYAYDALEPSIDALTMHLHHDKHHAAYVAKLNEAVAKEPSLAGKSVDDLLKDLPSVPETVRMSVRNNGGGDANHSLFWLTLSPKGGQPSDVFAKAIDAELGGLPKLKEDLTKAGLSLFGSGWAWIVLDANKKLKLTTTPNQDSPISAGQFPVFGFDVWEHAYYLKYHNVRADYLKAIWAVVNWKFISQRYETALKS